MKIIVVAVIITLILILVLSIILLKQKKKQIKDLLIKIDEAEENIKILLNKKADLLSTMDKLIEEKSEKDIIDDKDSMKNIDDTHELNKVLNNYYDSMIELIDYDSEIILDDDESTEFDKLKAISLELTGVEKYYNDNIAKLNKYSKRFPASLFTSSKKKEPYINEKNEIFEILKQ